MKIVRDIFGAKPVYYTEKNDQIYISDRIKPILNFVEPKINDEVALDYLHRGLVNHRRETFFEGIKQLRPGEVLRYNGENIEIDNPDYSIKPDENLEKLLHEEIEEKIPEDNFICPVSGGLDSSIVASKSGEKADFYHSIFDVETGDEKYYSALKEDLDYKIKEINIRAEELIENIDESIDILEQPSSMIAVQAQNLFFSKIYEISGSSQIVEGTGADELFYGYPDFLPYYINEAFQKNIFHGLKAFKNYSYGFDTYKNRELIRLLSKGLYPHNLYNPEIDHNPEYNRPDSLEEAMKRNIEVFDLPHILHSMDKNASAYGHEVRSAFLSAQLLAGAESIDPEENFENGLTKKVLRSVFKDDLPEQIIQRKKKTGFIQLDNKHFNSEIKEKFDQVFSSSRFQDRDLFDGNLFYKRFERNIQNFFKCYRFYCFEKWTRRFID